jgi:predicted histidine transporter YuiF (NhaC family)
MSRNLIVRVVDVAAVTAELTAEGYSSETQQQVIAFLQANFEPAQVQSEWNLLGYFAGGIKASGLKNKAKQALAALCEVEQYSSNCRTYLVSCVMSQFYTYSSTPIVK